MFSVTVEMPGEFLVISFYGHEKLIIVSSPGRFFAVTEIKAFMAHMLMNYDISWNVNAPPFKHLWFNYHAIPDPSASILIRKRKGGVVS